MEERIVFVEKYNKKRKEICLFLLQVAVFVKIRLFLKNIVDFKTSL
jgi:hypothetical protein